MGPIPTKSETISCSKETTVYEEDKLISLSSQLHRRFKAVTVVPLSVEGYNGQWPWLQWSVNPTGNNIMNTLNIC